MVVHHDDVRVSVNLEKQKKEEKIQSSRCFWHFGLQYEAIGYGDVASI
jgi:hypothetical protein